MTEFGDMFRALHGDYVVSQRGPTITHTWTPERHTRTVEYGDGLTIVEVEPTGTIHAAREQDDALRNLRG